MWKKISISDVQTCTRVDDVHINIDFKSEQRTYKLRFPTGEDCDFFLKIMSYVQDELSIVQERRSRERSTTLERQASSLRNVSNPHVVSSRLDNDISARSVRMEFIAKDLSFTRETCKCVCVCVFCCCSRTSNTSHTTSRTGTIRFRPQISRLAAIGMVSKGSNRSRFELSLSVVQKKKSGFGSLVSLRRRPSTAPRMQCSSVSTLNLTNFVVKKILYLLLTFANTLK